jgi:hypothetical protein
MSRRATGTSCPASGRPCPASTASASCRSRLNCCRWPARSSRARSATRRRSPARSCRPGELDEVIKAGYAPAAGVFGVHRYHHVAEDDERCLDAPATLAAAQGFRKRTAQTTKRSPESSTDRRNTLGEGLRWGSIEQGLSWPFVELPGDGAELGLAVQGQIGSVGQVLSQQPVGVFVRAALPWRPGIAEVDLDVRGEGQPLVVGQFLAPIPGQGLVEFARQFPDCLIRAVTTLWCPCWRP